MTTVPIFNANDGYYHCTNAMRLALDVTKLPDTQKYYEVDTRLSYEVFNGEWHEI
jgi:hypothetical protein